MDNIRVSNPDRLRRNDCDRMHIEDYRLEEVLLPAAVRRKGRKAIHVVIRGRNFRATAQPIMAFVGELPVKFLRISPDERSVEGVLLEEPQAHAAVTVIHGDQDAVRHPTLLDPANIKRIA